MSGVSRLGIAVVYLVEAQDDDLLDLHLATIRAHTDVPFTIYGSAERLPAGLRARLETRGVRVCSVSCTGLRGYMEHAHYLDQLVEIAVADGASHVCTLNVDSFPIAPGWAQRLASRLSPERPLAAVRRDENRDAKPHPSCMFFLREFYSTLQPRMLLTDDEQARGACAAELEGGRVVNDTGIGYLHALQRGGLEWAPLLRSNKASDHYIIGSVYDDLVFHLGGATRALKIHVSERAALDSSPRRRVVSAGAAWTGRFLPAAIRRRLSPLRLYAISPAAKRALDAGQEAYDRARARLRKDPDAYFRYLREGPGGDST